MSSILTTELVVAEESSQALHRIKGELEIEDPDEEEAKKIIRRNAAAAKKIEVEG